MAQTISVKPVGARRVGEKKRRPCNPPLPLQEGKMQRTFSRQLPLNLVVHGIANDGAGHAVAAAATATQFGPDDGDDFDPFFPQGGIGGGVAVVGDDNPRFQADEVVTAVPLLALAGVDVACGFHNAELFQVEGLGHHIHKRVSFF